MALSLRELKVDSVPINILIPLPGTPLAETPLMNPDQVLRSIALYRIIHPDVPVRLAGGREHVLRDFLSMAFMAGVDGMMEPEELCDSVIEALDQERFLILPHKEVLTYMQRKSSDYDRWIKGMRRLQALFGAG